MDTNVIGTAVFAHQYVQDHHATDTVPGRRRGVLRVAEDVIARQYPQRGHVRRWHLRWLRGPTAKGHERQPGGDHGAAGAAAGSAGGGLLEHADSLLQGMARGPVAAKRQADRRELGLEHGFAVTAAIFRMAAKHGGIAGQFLVQPEAPSGHVHKRVEPEQASQRGGQCLRGDVPASQVFALVRQQQRLFAGVVARSEIARQHDARSPQAEHRRAGFVALVELAARLAADLACEAPLGADQGRGQDQCTEAPGQQERGAWIDGCLQHRRLHARQRLRRPGRRDRRMQGKRGRLGQKHGHQGEGHRGPGQIRQFRAEGATEQGAQQQHQRDGQGAGKNQLLGFVPEQVDHGTPDGVLVFTDVIRTRDYICN